MSIYKNEYLYMRTVETTQCSFNRVFHGSLVNMKVSLTELSGKIWALTVIMLLLWEDRILNSIDINEQSPPALSKKKMLEQQF